jgi:UDPglucose 6-dehydrogenase
LAYKADTDSIKNSPAIALIDGLSGKRVAVYDPLVQGARLGRDLVVAPSALDAVEGADVVAIMTPWKEFAVLAAADLAKRMRGRTVIDPYGMLATAAVSGAGLRHVTLGRPVHVQ